MSNASNDPPKTRRGVGTSCSVLIFYLRPDQFNVVIYINKYKYFSLSGIITTMREVRRVTRRYQLYSFMEKQDFKYKELHCIQRQVIVDTEGSGANVFEDIEQKEDEGTVVVESDQRETIMHETTQEDINDFLVDRHELDNDQQP